MNIVLDIIIAGIIILCIYTGYKKGLVRSVMSLASFIIAFIMARIFSPPLSDFMYSNWIKPKFVSGAVERIDEILGNVSLEHMAGDPNRPESFTNLLKSYGVGLPDINKWISEAASKGADNLNEHIAENLVEPVAKGASDFIAFIAVLIAALILLKIVTGLIDRIVKLPGLNLLNKAGGIILGGIYGMVSSVIFAILVYYALPYLAANTPIGSARDVIDDTVLFRLFFNMSPV